MLWTWRWRKHQALHCVSADGELAIGVARDPNSIRIFSLVDDDVAVVVRNDHSAAITATAISVSINLACTCSSDAITFWKLDLLKSRDDSCDLSIGRILPLTACRSIRHAVFSSQSFLAIIDDTGSIFFIEINSGTIANTLQFKSCCFSLFIAGIFIALSEDGTFKIWSGEAYSELIYQSAVVCSSPLISGAAHPAMPRFTIASANGYIFVFEYTVNNGCRYMGRINIIEQLEHKEDVNCVGESELDISEALVMSNSVIGLAWNLIRESSIITVVTSTDVCIIHADSLSLSQTFPLEIPEDCCFVELKDSICCVLTFAFSNQTSLLQFDVNQFKEARLTHLCFASTEHLPDCSPLLKSNFLRKPKSTVKKKPLDKPILFHKRVRSSGYGASSSNKFSFSRGSIKAKPSSKNKEIRPELTPLTDYSCTSRIQVLDAERPTHNGPINAISFSDHGNSFLSCSTDSCVRLHRLKSTNSQVFTGHEASVKSAFWSSDSKMIVTASADRTAAIYQLPRLDPVCRITHTQTNLSSKCNNDNSFLPAEVNSARFFFKDTFVIMCYGSDVALYKYKLGTASSELSRPYQDYKFARIAGYKHNTESNGTITQIACHNSKASHIALASTRNRDLLMLDLSTGGSVISLINSAHDRPIHSICLGNLLHPVSSDIFCTASADNTIKLWDIRIKGPVRRFVGHINRQKQVGLALSPCSRYIAAGSEDQYVYIYELSTGRWVVRLRAQRDAISALSYCPTSPFLAAGAYDGTLVCYTS